MYETIETAVRAKFPEAVWESIAIDDTVNLKIDAGKLVEICEYLKSDPNLDFDYPADITAVDWSDRIELIYRLYSMKHKHKVALKLDLNRDEPIVSSVISVWKGADWQEREIFDLFGVKFVGHPDLRRILLPEEFEGYPLRKDYVIPE